MAQETKKVVSESPRLEVMGRLTEEYRGRLSTPADARRFLGEAGRRLQPPIQVGAGWWEHTLIAAELGRRIDPDAELALVMHDSGRLVNPAYLRNDFLGERLMERLGLGYLISQLASLRKLLNRGGALSINKKQLGLFHQGVPVEQILTEPQLVIAEDYFRGLTPIQRITNLADNLGKRTAEGKLFSLSEFLDYLRSQETRYGQKSVWSSEDWSVPRRQPAAVLQYYVVEKTAAWLQQERGINVEKIIAGLEDYGPKFIVLGRHGRVKNKRGIVYNRDRDMKPEDVVVLSEQGKQEVETAATLIKKRGLGQRLRRLIVSPARRARESAKILSRTLQFRQPKLEVDERVDDIYGPGPYLEGEGIEEWRRSGNPYDRRWGNYDHEKPAVITQRMTAVFWETARELERGEAAVLVSHKDPLAWLVNHLVAGQLPEPEHLHDLINLPEGGVILTVIDPEGKLLTAYQLTSDK